MEKQSKEEFEALPYDMVYAVKGKEIGKPACQNCGKEVPHDFPTLGHEESKKIIPCCSRECVDELFYKIHGKKPDWTKPKQEVHKQ